MTQPTSAPLDDNGRNDRLQHLADDLASEPNANSRAIVLISACITEGLNTAGPIVSKLIELGYGRKHVGSVLYRSTGTNPNRHYWRKGKDGVYSLLDPESRPCAVSAASLDVSHHLKGEAVSS